VDCQPNGRQLALGWNEGSFRALDFFEIRIYGIYWPLVLRHVDVHRRAVAYERGLVRISVRRVDTLEARQRHSVGVLPLMTTDFTLVEHGLEITIEGTLIYLTLEILLEDLHGERVGLRELLIVEPPYKSVFTYSGQLGALIPASGLAQVLEVDPPLSFGIWTWSGQSLSPPSAARPPDVVWPGPGVSLRLLARGFTC